MFLLKSNLMCKGIYYNRCLYFLKWSILVASLTSTWHMKSANNLKTLNRSHMIFLPFFNAFSCCVLLSKFPFDHKQSTLNIIQNSLFSTTISSWHRKKKDVCEVSPSKCPNESTLWWTPEAAHLTELIHLWQLLQWTFSLISLSLCVCVCVCCLFMNPLQNGQR